MRPILLTSISSLLARCIITHPIPAFGDDDGGTVAVDKPDVQLGLDDKVAGEEPPDFSFLDKDGDKSTQDDRQGASGTIPAVQEPEPTVKPVAGTPPKVPITDPNEKLEIPAVQPAKETTEQPVPDPKEQAEAAAAQKKVDAEKVETDRHAAEAAAKTAEVKLPTDEELEAMQPKPGAPKQYITDFKNLKEAVLKPAIAEAKRLKAELETLKAAPALTDEIKQKLAVAEEDRAWREAFELEKDPKLQAEFAGMTTKAEDSLFKMLVDHPRLKMKPEAVQALKEMGLDSELGRENRQKILDAVKGLGDDILFDEVKDAFKARDGVLRQRDAKLAELREKQTDLVKFKDEREKEERMAWARECDVKLIDKVKDQEMFLLKNIPDGATPAQIAQIEAHNKGIKEELVPKMHEGIRALYSRDPEKTMQYMLDSLRMPKVIEERDKLKTELEAAQKRVAELEGDGARLRRVASPSRIEGTAPTKAEAPGPVNMTADEAVDQFRREKGLM